MYWEKVLEEATRLIERGWTICGITPGTKDQQTSPTNDLTDVRRWLENDQNIGLGVCVYASGLVVFDIDTEDGLDWFNQRNGAAEHVGPMVRTLRGYHLYFQAPPDPPETGTIWFEDLYVGDLISCHWEYGDSYAVAPPSRFVTDAPLLSGAYWWQNFEAELPSLPAWLMEFHSPRKPPSYGPWDYPDEEEEEDYEYWEAYD